MHKHPIQIYEELVPSVLPLLKEHIKLGHAGSTHAGTHAGTHTHTRAHTHARTHTRTHSTHSVHTHTHTHARTHGRARRENSFSYGTDTSRQYRSGMSRITANVSDNSEWANRLSCNDHTRTDSNSGISRNSQTSGGQPC